MREDLDPGVGAAVRFGLSVLVFDEPAWLNLSCICLRLRQSDSARECPF